MLTIANDSSTITTHASITSTFILSENIPEIPDDILLDILNKDQWAYIEEYNKFKSKHKTPAAKKSGIPSNSKKEEWIHLTSISEEEKLELQNFMKNQVKKRYVNWFHIITRTGVDKPVSLLVLQTQLDIIYNDNKSFYDKNGGIYARFAAIMTRSFKISCGIQHDVVLNIEHNVLPGQEFTTELFSWIPTWDISNETIQYIDLLRFAHFIKPNPPKWQLNTHHTTNQPILDMPKVHCLNAYNQKLKKAVCLPYYISKEREVISLVNDMEGEKFNPTPPSKIVLKISLE